MIFDKRWRARRRVRRMGGSRELNARGQYEMQYLIDKYINLTRADDDYIEAYENDIAKLEQADSFKILYASQFVPYEDVEQENVRRHIYAALLTFSHILYTLTEEESINVLEKIEPELLDDFLLWHKSIVRQARGENK